MLRFDERNTKAPLVANTSDENWEILLYYSCQHEVANAWWDKTGSCRATNEGEWVTPTSEASPGVHYSKKHPFVVISIEKN